MKRAMHPSHWHKHWQPYSFLIQQPTMGQKKVHLTRLQQNNLLTHLLMNTHRRRRTHESQIFHILFSMQRIMSGKTAGAMFDVQRRRIHRLQRSRRMGRCVEAKSNSWPVRDQRNGVHAGEWRVAVCRIFFQMCQAHVNGRKRLWRTAQLD